jgi:outer membrane receptor protein involved in Fe transport
MRYSRGAVRPFTPLRALAQSFLLFSTIVLFAGPAVGQSALGSISGIVTDAQGAPIAGAEVTASNTQTNVPVSTRTNDSGVYDIPYLKLGTYEVHITAPGMKEALVRGVLVDQNNISRVDQSLQIGNVSESVTVQASAPLLQQESTTYDATVNRKFVEDLPVAFNGGTRDSTSLALLVPGVVNGTTYGSQFGVNIGGGRQFSTEFQIDGMAVAYQGVTANVPLDSRPDQDLINEVKVQIGVPNAEYGRTSSGVVEYLTRSGTSDLHGNATMLVRNTILDARAYNSAAVGRDQQWELALSLGGPVYIPKIYNGKKRTFFFFNYTAFRQAPGGNPTTVTVPTAQERAGNFSALSYPIYSPTTHQVVPGNIIPVSQLSPIALALEKLFPSPTNNNLVNNFNGFTPTFTQANHYFAKIDHNFTDNNRLSGSFRFQHAPSLLAEGSPFAEDISSNTVFKGVQQLIVSDDVVISPHLVNHLAASEEGFLATQNSQPLNPATWTQIPNSFGAAFPSFCFTTNGYASIGTGLGNCSPGSVNKELDRSRDLQDAVTWNRGTHTYKFGARYLWFQAATAVYNSRNGTYTFSQSETGQTQTSSNGSQTIVPGTGNSFASFLFGAVDTANMSLQQPPANHTQNIGLYAQDDWKVNRKLSLTYGLRWDFQTPVYEGGGLISYVNVHQPNPGAGNLLGAYVFGGKQGAGFTNYGNAFYGAWAPRIGLAYTVTPSTVLRVSAGILYAPPNNSTDETGYSGTATGNTPNGGVTPAFYWDQGWPSNLVHPPPYLNSTIANGQSANTIAGNGNRWSNTNSVQVDIQQSFARNYVINIGYLGQSTHHLPNESMNVLDQVNPKYLSLGSLLNDSITNPAVAAAGYSAPYPGFVSTWGSGATLAQALKPYPQYFSLTPLGDAVGNASYNALLLKAEKRFSSGFQYLVSYTWSKTLTDSALSAFGRSGPQDTFNRGAEKALSPYDIPQNLVISFTYQLPWGPGTPFLNKGILGNIFGGWSVSGILTYQSGTPISVTAPNTLPLGNDRLDAVYLGGPIETDNAGRGNVSLANGLTGQAGTVTLNRSAFGFPAPFTFGNTFILPNVRTIGLDSENLGLAKRETFREKYLFELRLELFNAFNRKEFGGLITDLTNPAFGQYTGVGLGPRNCQIAGRFVF